MISYEQSLFRNILSLHTEPNTISCFCFIVMLFIFILLILFYILLKQQSRTIV